MNSEELLKYTAQCNDEESIKYVLGSRYNKEAGLIEYLVRFNNPNIEYDEWIKASDLTCSKKIMDFINGKFLGIEKHERPKNLEEKIEQPTNNDNDDKFTIYGVESVRNELLLKVHIPNQPGIVIVDSKELIPEYENEIIEYYEKHCFEK